MPNYIQTLKSENEELRRQLEEAQQNKTTVVKEQYSDLPDELDGRGELVDILYRNPNAPRDAAGGSKFLQERLPLGEAFNKLVSFHSAFPRPTDRNVPKNFWDGTKPVLCNQSVCYIKVTYVDKTSGQRIENLRKEVPLWLAVDMIVQQDKNVELISKKEYEDFQNLLIKDELRRDRAFQDKKRSHLLEELIREETTN